MRTVPFLLAVITASLCACANYRDSPRYAVCVAESKTPVPAWYSIGTAQAEMLRMCVEAKEATTK